MEEELPQFQDPLYGGPLYLELAQTPGVHQIRRIPVGRGIDYFEVDTPLGLSVIVLRGQNEWLEVRPPSGDPKRIELAHPRSIEEILKEIGAAPL